MAHPGSRSVSAEFVELHVFIVPSTLWLEKYKTAINNVAQEATSAGFVRVSPSLRVDELRHHIYDQLGEEELPKSFVFLRMVGRCMAMVNWRQELKLKAKHFHPPITYAPEIFLLPGTHQSLGIRDSVEGSVNTSIDASKPHDHHEGENYGPDTYRSSSSDAGHGSESNTSSLSRPFSTDDLPLGDSQDSNRKGSSNESHERDGSDDTGIGSLSPGDRSEMLTEPWTNGRSKPFRLKALKGQQRSKHMPHLNGSTSYPEIRVLQSEQERVLSSTPQQRNLSPISPRENVTETDGRDDENHEKEPKRDIDVSLPSQAYEETLEENHIESNHTDDHFNENGTYELNEENPHDNYKNSEKEDIQQKQLDYEKKLKKVEHDKQIKLAEQEVRRKLVDNEDEKRRGLLEKENEDKYKELQRLIKLKQEMKVKDREAAEKVADENQRERDEKRSKVQMMKDNIASVQNDKYELQKEREAILRGIKVLNADAEEFNDSIWRNKFLDEKQRTKELEDQLVAIRKSMDERQKKIVSSLNRNGDLKKTPNQKDRTPSELASQRIILQRLKQRMDDTQSRVENTKVKLNNEIKLRSEVDEELKLLRPKVMETKIKKSLNKTPSRNLPQRNTILNRSPRT